MSTENIATVVRRRTNGVAEGDTATPVLPPVRADVGIGSGQLPQIDPSMQMQNPAPLHETQESTVLADLDVALDLAPIETPEEAQSLAADEAAELGPPHSLPPADFKLADAVAATAADPAVRVKRKYTKRAVVEAKAKPTKVKAVAKAKATKVPGKRGRKPALDDAKQAKLKALFKSGGSLTKAARVFRVSIATARRFAKLWGVDVPLQNPRGRKAAPKGKAAAKKIKAKLRTAKSVTVAKKWSKKAPKNDNADIKKMLAALLKKLG